MTPVIAGAMDESRAGRASAERRFVLVGLALASLLAVATWSNFLANRSPGTEAALESFPLDDAWIHLVYARSLATEGAFHYNPGVPEAGMTSPLWVVLAAGAHLVSAPFGVPAVVLATKLLSLLFGLASVWALHALAREFGLSSWAALLAALLAAVDPAMTFSRAAGMEVPLFTFLVLVALVLAHRGELIATGVVLGLALVARPEGALVLPSVAALVWFAERRREAEQGRARRRMIAFVAAAMPALLWSAFCLSVTGRPLPNTFYAKFRSDAGSALGNVVLGWRDYLHGAEPYFAFEAGTVLAAIGAFALVRRRGASAAAVVGAGVLLFCGTLASRGFSAGHFHYWERWLIPAYPFFLLACAAGVDAVASRLARGGERRRLAGAVAAALALLLVAKLPTTLELRADEYAWNCRNIEEMNVELGRWVAANVPEADAIAVADAGAIRYFGGRRTVDLLGLNDHRIKSELRSERGAAYLEERGVRWFVLFPALATQLVARLGLEPVYGVRAERYTIARAPQDEMVVYRWPSAGAPVGTNPPE